MTSYSGGKQKIGKEIAECIIGCALYFEDESSFKPKGYCEPFCGMLGVYEPIYDISNDFWKSFKWKAGDVNKSVILMWKASQKGWKPPTRCSEAKFQRLRYDGKDSAEKGFIGHQFSFGGQYFRGHREKYGNSPSSRYKSVSAKVSKIGKNLKKVDFSAGNYTRYGNLKNYIIYCDPPYAKCNMYFDKNLHRRKFDNKKFWTWARKMSKDNLVFISELEAPKDFISIWEKNIIIGNNVHNQKHKQPEKLFLHSNWL